MSIPTYIDLTETDQISQLWEYMRSRQVGIGENPTNVIEDDISTIIDATGHIWKKDVDCKDLEGIVNSIISLLFTVPVNNGAPLVHKLCTKLEEGAQVEGKAHLSFRLLHILFNGYPIENSFLYDVFCSWTKVCNLSQNSIRHLPCDLSKIARWIELWGREESCSLNLYRLMYETQYNCGQYKKASEVMISLLECFTNETASDARDDAVKCIQRSIMDENTFVFDHLLALAPIQALQGELIHTLLGIFVGGSIQDYLKFHEENGNFMEENGLCHDDNIRKMRLLTLVDVIGNQRELSFDDVMKGLEIDESQLEELVIDAIITKLIRGRIDEVNRTIIVSQACQRSFDDGDWNKLAACLSKCKNQLTLVCEQLTSIH